MLSPQDIESELSYAYLHAVATHAGVICERSERLTDNLGIDATFRIGGRLAGGSLLTQFTVDVQLKATKKIPIETDDRYSYSLARKNYDEHGRSRQLRRNCWWFCICPITRKIGFR